MRSQADVLYTWLLQIETPVKDLRDIPMTNIKRDIIRHYEDPLQSYFGQVLEERNFCVQEWEMDEASSRPHDEARMTLDQVRAQFEVYLRSEGYTKKSVPEKAWFSRELRKAGFPVARKTVKKTKFQWVSLPIPLTVES